LFYFAEVADLHTQHKILQRKPEDLGRLLFRELCIFEHPIKGFIGLQTYLFFIPVFGE
jgi:hypothetical protein